MKKFDFIWEALDENNWVVLAVILALFIVMSIISSKAEESFCGGSSYARGGRNCNNIESASAMCTELAQSNCRIPTYPMNDCWLNQYNKCTNYCKGTNTLAICDCTKVATDKCGSSGCPAESCFKGLHQKCMAGYGFATDPDRGSPSLSCQNCK